MLADAPGAVARELLAQDGARVVAALAAPDDQNGIHAARKAIRRMRAVLALLDEDEFELEREDRSLRRLGKSLSALRDAHVVVEAAKRLQVLHPGPAWAGVVGTLEQRRADILQRAAAVDPQFARRRGPRSHAASDG
ncbi:CHAD domain-containing protein [Stenotrophomonas rhizophila]|uniref:CHAD domain-containing protein n=1 Tax=Stenotrophomonas rhizophila TaxID=216778 RepID=UPI003AF56369